MAPTVKHFGAIMGHNVAEMHEEPLRPIGPDEILVKGETCNICTTDYQQWQGLRDHQGFPMAGGHEWSGIIVEKGEKVIDMFQVGDRVGTGGAGCGMCDNCRRGLTSDCSSRAGGRQMTNGFYGQHAFADYIILNQRTTYKLSKEISAAEAGFLEPLATAVSGNKKVRVSPMEDVVVIGAGTMGLVNAQVAHAFGARVMISELTPKKLERAASMGFADIIDAKNCDPVEEVKKLTGGKGADVVIVAVGNTFAYKQAYAMLKPLRGRILLFAAGYPKPEMQIDPNEIHYRKIEIIGTMSGNTADFVDSAQLMGKKLVNMSYSLEGKVFPLREIQAAYEAAATPDMYRVTVDLQGI